MRITVNALTGDAQKGQEAISKLMSFAAKTPFEINDLSGMFTTITANGLDAFETLTSAKNGFQQELMGFIETLWHLDQMYLLCSGVQLSEMLSVVKYVPFKNALDVDVEGIFGSFMGEIHQNRLHKTSLTLQTT